jgi:hypothetical protein
MSRDGRPANGIDVLGLFLDGITHHLDADVTMLRRVRDAVIAWGRAEGADVSALEAGAASEAALPIAPAVTVAAVAASRVPEPVVAAPSVATAGPAPSRPKATVRRLPVKRLVRGRKRRQRPAPRRQAPPSRRVAGR